MTWKKIGKLWYPFIFRDQQKVGKFWCCLSSSINTEDLYINYNIDGIMGIFTSEREFTPARGGGWVITNNMPNNDGFFFHTGKKARSPNRYQVVPHLEDRLSDIFFLLANTQTMMWLSFLEKSGQISLQCLSRSTSVSVSNARLEIKVFDIFPVFWYKSLNECQPNKCCGRVALKLGLVRARTSKSRTIVYYLENRPIGLYRNHGNN